MTTKFKTTAPALLAAATLFLTACGSDDQPLQATPPTTTAAAASSTSASSVAESSMPESSMTESSESSISDSDDPSETPSSDAPTSEASSTESSTSEPSTSEPSTPASSSAAPESGGTGKQVVIKAGAGKSLPAKVGAWVKAPGSGPGSIYDQGSDSVVSSFLARSDYAGISTAVKTEKTPVSAGLCGGTGVEGSYTCYLKTADGVINVAGDDLKPVVDFSDELTKTLGAS